MKTRDGHLYWNNWGHINCSLHAPYSGSDTWLMERWERVPVEVVQAKGFKCETCGFMPSPAQARPLVPTLGRRSRRWRVRANREYSIEIEAVDAEEAIEKAGHVDFEQPWTQAWAPLEVDEEA